MPPYPPGIPAGAYTANDVPTCEGALQLAMEQTEHTLQGASCLVIGYGRIGALLAHKLHALDAAVTVSARSPRDFARIEADGMRALDTRSLAGRLSAFQLIFNTVPAPVLGAAELSSLSTGCLVIDLASLPGGISADAKLPEMCIRDSPGGGRSGWLRKYLRGRLRRSRPLANRRVRHPL